MTRCLSIREKFDNNKVCVLGNLSASMERFVLYKLFFFNVKINLCLIIKVEKLSHGLTIQLEEGLVLDHARERMDKIKEKWTCMQETKNKRESKDG